MRENLQVTARADLQVIVKENLLRKLETATPIPKMNDLKRQGSNVNMTTLVNVTKEMGVGTNMHPKLASCTVNGVRAPWRIHASTDTPKLPATNGRDMEHVRKVKTAVSSILLKPHVRSSPTIF